MKAFNSGLEIATEKEQISILVLLGECHVQLGNLAQDESAETDYYQKAVSYFEQVQQKDADALPEPFQEILLGWQDDME